MSSVPFFQRFSAIALAIASAVPLSASAETRRLSETDVSRIAAQVLNTIMATRRAQPPAPQAGPPRQTTPTPAQASPTTSAVTAQSILVAMNAERQARGLGPLRLDSRLSAAASDRARDMFDKHYFDHVAPDGTQLFVWVKRHSYRYSIVGENLAEGYRTASGIVDGWMDSPGHRANILGRSFQDVGLSIVRGSPTRRTFGYTVVALYGREPSARQSETLVSR